MELNPLYKLCFLCFSNRGKLKSINCKDADGILIIDKLKSFLSYNLKFSPHVPKLVCISCLETATKIYQFKRKCLQNITKFHEYIEKLVDQNEEIFCKSSLTKQKGTYKELSSATASKKMKFDINTKIVRLKSGSLRKEQIKIENDTTDKQINIRNMSKANNPVFVNGTRTSLLFEENVNKNIENVPKIEDPISVDESTSLLFENNIVIKEETSFENIPKVEDPGTSTDEEMHIAKYSKVDDPMIDEPKSSISFEEIFINEEIPDEIEHEVEINSSNNRHMFDVENETNQNVVEKNDKNKIDLKLVIKLHKAQEIDRTRPRINTQKIVIENVSALSREIRLREGDFLYQLRMNEECFDLLLRKIHFEDDNTLLKSITPRDRLVIALRYLVTGENIDILSVHFNIKMTLIRDVILDVVKAICRNLKDYIKMPSTSEEWCEIEKVFSEKWNFPNCCGAVDARQIHFVTKKSAKTDSRRDSLIILAVTDANYKFLYVNLTSPTCYENGSVFGKTSLNAYLKTNTFNMPNDVYIPETFEKTPFVFVGGDIAPFTPRIMKAFFPYRITKEQEIFNLRLNRAKKAIDHTFEIFARRFEVFINPLRSSEEQVKMITTACCILHNFMVEHRGEKYTEPDNYNLELRNIDKSLHSIEQSTPISFVLRTIFMDYFNTIGQIAEHKCS